MGDTPAIPGGELEHAVLRAVWELGSATAGEIHARVGKPRRLVYTTTAKVLDRLYLKGLVARRRTGRAFVYRPRADRAVVEGALAREAVSRLLAGQPRPAIAALVDAVAALDPNLIDELARLVATKRTGRHGS